MEVAGSSRQLPRPCIDLKKYAENLWFVDLSKFINFSPIFFMPPQRQRPFSFSIPE